MINTKEFLHNYYSINDLLFGFAMKLTKNKDEAKDLMQETIYKAFKNKDRFKVGTNFKAWITTIMHHSFISSYRKKKVRNRISAPLENVSYVLEGSRKTQADASAMLNDLVGIIEELKDNYKIPFLMAYRGFKYEEIAEELNLPLGTVKSRINYARKELKEKIEKNYGKEIRLVA